jgi:hypothetical protein
VFEITDAGRVEADARLAEAGGPPWDIGTVGARRRDVVQAIRGLHVAFRQIAEAGDAEQVDRAIAIVTDARKQLYQILASD